MIKWWMIIWNRIVLGVTYLRYTLVSGMFWDPLGSI